MPRDLRNDVLNVCRGFERDHILSTLQAIIDDNTPATMHNRYHMNPCPICGNINVHITDIMKGITQGNPRITAKKGFCTACNYHGPAVKLEDLPTDYTPAVWTKLAVTAWNNATPVSMFKAAEHAFGKDYQFFLVDEESFELIRELSSMGIHTSRDKRHDRTIPLEIILPEMADVIISIYQWLHSKDVPFTDLDKYIQKKVSRLCLTDAVRTAVLELSRNVIKMTTINAPTVDDTNSINTMK